MYNTIGRLKQISKSNVNLNNIIFRSAALPEPTIARFVKLRLSGPHPPAREDEQVQYFDFKPASL